MFLDEDCPRDDFVLQFELKDFICENDEAMEVLDNDR